MAQHFRLDKTSRWLISRADIGSDFYKEFKADEVLDCLGTIADIKKSKEPGNEFSPVRYLSTVVFEDGTEITITDYDKCDYYLVRPDVALQPPSTIDPLTYLNDGIRYLNTLDWPNWTVMMDIIGTDWTLVNIVNGDQPYALWGHDPSGTFYRIDAVKKILPEPNLPQFFFQPAYEVPPEAVFTVPTKAAMV